MDVFISLVSILGLIVASFALLVGLFSAPWQILLLLLAVGLFGLRWLSVQGDRLRLDIQDESAQESGNTSESPTSPRSDLVYRGARYQRLPDAEATQSLEMSGKYRGGIWHSVQSIKPPPH